MFFFSKKSVVAEKRILLKKITWPKFTEILNELGTDRTVNLTYDRGRLELMTPQDIHDRARRLLDSMLIVMADESDETLHGLGSILLVNPQDGQAIQPFAAYYLDYPPKPITGLELDVTNIAPPDLIVDVILGEGSIPRLPMFESMGISEVWRYRSQVTEGAVQGELEIWQLTSAGYRLTEMSLAFPELSVLRIQAFIAESDTLGLSKALTLLRNEFAT